MSKDDLKKQVRVLAHELQLSTYINKGAISESTDLKVRVAELERQNTALRAAETRLTATEEKLEEQEEEIKEKEAQIKRLKESLCGMRESLRNMTRQRDTWTHRWDRMKNMIKKEDAELEESDTEPPTDFPTMHEKVVNNPPVRSDAYQRASPPSVPASVPSRAERVPTLAESVHRHEEANGPFKVPSGSHHSLNKKRRRRIGDESSSDDEPYKPYKPASSDQTVCRPRSVREKKKPAIQLSVVKLETPTPEPEPELPDAPSKSARRRKRDKRDEGDESDDALGQW